MPRIPSFIITTTVAVVIASALSGCVHSSRIDDILSGRKVDYERNEHQGRKELQYPPDIVAAQSDRQGSQLLSEYRIEAVPDLSTSTEVQIGSARKVSYRREGNVRWIDVDLSPPETWALTEKFWDDLGFALVQKDTQVGTLETDWLDLRQSVPSLGLGVFLDNFLKRTRDSGERDKFITRVEARDEYSSVFIVHRHIAAQFDKAGLFSGYQPLPPDAQLEAEMLRRVMLYAARIPPEDTATAFVDDVAAAEQAAASIYQLQERQLLIHKPLEESWLLVRIGLDRGGFTIDDQDYGNRVYYIRHTGGPESQQIFGKASTSFWDKIFGEEKPVLREIKLLLTRDGASTVVEAQASDDGVPLSEEQAAVLLSLLNDNLP